MDASGANAGAKAAIGTLRDSLAIGKEGGKLVGDIQADMHNSVMSAQRAREKARRATDNLGSHQEQEAYRKFLEREDKAKATAELKAHIIKTHGVKAWDEYLKIKLEVEKQDLEEAKLVKSDEDKINDVFWWCIAAGCLISCLVVAF